MPGFKISVWRSTGFLLKNVEGLVGGPAVLDLDGVLEIPEDVVERRPAAEIVGDAVEGELHGGSHGVVGEGAADGAVRQLPQPFCSLFFRQGLL